MHQLSGSLRRYTLSLLLAVGILTLTACGGRITNTNWAGLSTDGERVFLAFGPRVLAYDPETQTQNWIYPAEDSAVQFYSTPAINGEQIVFGDYGRPGGFFSPRVTTSIYALENVDSGAPREIWINSEAATDKVVAPPLFADGTLYVGTADNNILALSPEDGSLLWEYETGHAIWGQPAYADGVLYVTSMDHAVYALDTAESGEVLWRIEFEGALPSSPILGDGLIYVSSFDGNVHALDMESGDVRWSAPAGNWVWGAAALVDGVVYFSDIDGRLFAVDAQTGEQLWTHEAGVNVVSSPVVVGDNLYIASGTEDDTPTGALTAYSASDGRQLWSQPTSVPLTTTPVVIGDDTIVVGMQNADTLLIGFDLATGQELWRYALPEPAN